MRDAMTCSSHPAWGLTHLGLVGMVPIGHKYVAHLPDCRQLPRGSIIQGVALVHAFVLQLFQQASLAHARLALHHNDATLLVAHQPGQPLCHLQHRQTSTLKLGAADRGSFDTVERKTRLGCSYSYSYCINAEKLSSERCVPTSTFWHCDLLNRYKDVRAFTKPSWQVMYVG